MKNLLLIERMKALSGEQPIDLFEVVMLEENIFKKAALAAAIITQILTNNGLNTKVTSNDIKTNPDSIIAKLDTISSVESDKAKDLVDKVSKAVNQNAVSASGQVQKQISLVRELANRDGINIDSLSYLVLDDAEDMMYHVIGDSIARKMYVVTGAEKGDTLDVDDYIEWLTKNKKAEIASAIGGGDAALKQIVLNSEAEFFDYVGKKITPGGIYTLEANPKFNAFLKQIAYGEEMIKSQPQYYGDIGVIQPKDLSGKRQFWLIHGTGNKERLTAIASQSGGRNMSLGCVNVNKEDNQYLVDLVSSNPDMVIMNLSDDGQSILEISDKAYQALFGKSAISADNSPLENGKESVTYEIEINFYDVLRKVTPDSFSPVVSGGRDIIGTITPKPTVDVDSILDNIRKDIEAYFDVKIYGNKDIPAMIRILKLFPVQIRNKYVNTLKKYMPDVANQLASKKYRDGALSENFFKKIGDKLSSLFKKKIDNIDKNEVQLVGTLNKIGNYLGNVYKDKGEIPYDIRQKVNKKVEEVMEDIINQYETAIKTLVNS